MKRHKRSLRPGSPDADGAGRAGCVRGPARHDGIRCPGSRQHGAAVMSEPEPKRSIGAIIGRTLNRPRAAPAGPARHRPQAAGALRPHPLASRPAWYRSCAAARRSRPAGRRSAGRPRHGPWRWGGWGALGGACPARAGGLRGGVRGRGGRRRAGVVICWKIAQIATQNATHSEMDLAKFL